MSEFRISAPSWSKGQKRFTRSDHRPEANMWRILSRKALVLRCTRAPGNAPRRACRRGFASQRTLDFCLDNQSYDLYIRISRSDSDGGNLKSNAYFRLWQINRGFARVLDSLDALRRHPAFRRRELNRCRAISQEARSLINSYLTEALEIIETNQAGRRYRKRLASERKDEHGE